MSYPIAPDKLLRQARALAGVGAGRGRPSPTDQRRAVSAAYYAAFHAINLAAVAHGLPNPADDEETRQATRWINHRDVFVVSSAVSTCAVTTTPIHGMPKGLSSRAQPLWHALSEPHPQGGRVSTVSSQLRQVVDSFLALQVARHSADYDHLAEFPKATTIGYVEEAARALDLLEAHGDEAGFQRFFAWVLARATAFAV